MRRDRIYRNMRGRYAGDGPPHWKLRSGNRGEVAARQDMAMLLKVAETLEKAAESEQFRKADWLASTAVEIRKCLATAQAARRTDERIDAGYEARELRQKALEWLNKEADVERGFRKAVLLGAVNEIDRLQPSLRIRLNQNAAEAEVRRRRTVKRLRKAVEGEHNAERKAKLLEIAKKIGACGARPRQWCRHAACPFCARTLQRWFVDHATQAVMATAGSDNHEDVSFMSWILPRRLTLSPSLRHIADTVANTDREAKKALADAGITRFLGGYDFSVNVDLDGVIRVQIQIWAAGLRRELEAARSRMKAAFPSKPFVRQPVKTYPFDGYHSAFAYAVKPMFKRRLDQPPNDQPTTRSTTWRNTDNRELTQKETADLALVLDALGSDRRLFMVGFVVDRDDKGAAVIRPTPVAMITRDVEGQYEENDANDDNTWARYEAFL